MKQKLLALYHAIVPQSQLKTETPTDEELKACTLYWQTHFAYKVFWFSSLLKIESIRSPGSFLSTFVEVAVAMWNPIKQILIGIVMFIVTFIMLAIVIVLWPLAFTFLKAFGFMYKPWDRDFKIIQKSVRDHKGDTVWPTKAHLEWRERIGA